MLAAAGFGHTGADIFNRGGPYLARGAADLVPSAQLLDTYSPEVYCAIRNLHDGEPKVAAFAGGANGYSLRSETEIFSGLGLTLSLPGLGLTLASMGLVAASRTGRWSAQSICLPGEPATGKRSRRAGRCTGLLADHHP